MASIFDMLQNPQEVEQLAMVLGSRFPAPPEDLLPGVVGTGTTMQGAVGQPIGQLPPLQENQIAGLKPVLPGLEKLPISLAQAISQQPADVRRFGPGAGMPPLPNPIGDAPPPMPNNGGEGVDLPGGGGIGAAIGTGAAAIGAANQLIPKPTVPTTPQVPIEDRSTSPTPATVQTGPGMQQIGAAGGAPIFETDPAKENRTNVSVEDVTDTAPKVIVGAASGAPAALPPGTPPQGTVPVTTVQDVTPATSTATAPVIGAAAGAPAAVLGTTAPTPPAPPMGTTSVQDVTPTPSTAVAPVVGAAAGAPGIAAPTPSVGNTGTTSVQDVTPNQQPAVGAGAGAGGTVIGAGTAPAPAPPTTTGNVGIEGPFDPTTGGVPPHGTVATTTGGAAAAAGAGGAAAAAASAGATVPVTTIFDAVGNVVVQGTTGAVIGASGQIAPPVIPPLAGGSSSGASGLGAGSTGGAAFTGVVAAAIDYSQTNSAKEATGAGAGAFAGAELGAKIGSKVGGPVGGVVGGVVGGALGAITGAAGLQAQPRAPRNPTFFLDGQIVSLPDGVKPPDGAIFIPGVTQTGNESSRAKPIGTLKVPKATDTVEAGGVTWTGFSTIPGVSRNGHTVLIDPTGNLWSGQSRDKVLGSLNFNVISGKFEGAKGHVEGRKYVPGPDTSSYLSPADLVPEAELGQFQTNLGKTIGDSFKADPTGQNLLDLANRMAGPEVNLSVGDLKPTAQPPLMGQSPSQTLPTATLPGADQLAVVPIQGPSQTLPTASLGPPLPQVQVVAPPTVGAASFPRRPPRQNIPPAAFSGENFSGFAG